MTGKVISTVIITLIAVLFLFCSCGPTKVVARVSDAASSTITISTNTPTNVEVTPNVNVEFLTPENK